MHRTEFCQRNCYNKKLYRIYPNMKSKDLRNERFWSTLTGTMFKTFIERKRKPTNRFRFCSRGDSFPTISDVDRMRNILLVNEDILFWIPTRAWRDNTLRRKLIKEIMPLENHRMMASIDPSNTEDEIKGLQKDGFSTLFFGDDRDTDNRILCPKTWNDRHHFCIECGNGCFSDSRVDVHLKKH